MKFEIRHRWNGSVVFTAEIEADAGTGYGIKLGLAVKAAIKSSADLSGADLRGAYLRGAYLSGVDLRGVDLSGAYLSSAYLSSAYLRGADLSGADLSGADLSGADLSGADLRGAYLRGAYLSGAKGISGELSTSLMVLLDQPGAIRAYKLVNEHGEGPINGGLKYPIGQSVEVPDACTDPAIECAAGINVATLDWCLRKWRQGYRILVVEFTAADIAAIPLASDGKFRLHRCKVVSEKVLDYAAIGLVKAEEKVAA